MAAEATSGENQTLNQNEIEALLSQVSETQVAPPAADATQPAATEAGPRRFGFREPSFLNATELRKLRQRHDEFARTLVTRLSIYLRLEFGAQISGLETQACRRFVEGLSNPTHLALFRVEPLCGVGLLEMTPALGMAMVDRLLGGPGLAPSLDRELSEIEVEILDLAFLPLLKEWCQEVTHLAEAKPQLVGHETNPRYLGMATQNQPLLAVSLDARMNEAKGVIKLGVPSQMLEPVLRQLATVVDLKKAESAAAATERSRWSPQLNDVPVPVSAHWTGLEITARELARLQVGDVLQFGAAQFSQVNVCVAKIPKFVGRLGTRDRAWAVELTGMAKT